MSLDPANLTPTASLNRVPFTALPGVPIPPTYINRTAFDLLSAQSITDRIRALPLDVSRLADLLPAFDQCFLAEDSTIRRMAEDIAQDVGYALGCLLLTLKLGDTVSRTKRPEWDESYWTYWANVEHVWFGGGMVSGNLGNRVADHAQQMLRRAGWENYQVRVSPYRRLLPLVGLARLMPVGIPSALVFDCGGSTVKSATAHYHGSSLYHLTPASTVPAPCQVTVADNPQQAAETLAYLLDVIYQSYRDAPEQSANQIGVSLACYLQNGQPFDRGCYGCLRLLSDNLQRLLADELSQRLKKPIQVILMHDGTAAAAAYAGTDRTAILMLGTALGVGFPSRTPQPIVIDRSLMT